MGKLKIDAYEPNATFDQCLRNISTRRSPLGTRVWTAVGIRPKHRGPEYEGQRT
jgi:hypothetical protein